MKAVEDRPSSADTLKIVPAPETADPSYRARAPLIALEGIDGSGKGTQAALLMAELARRGRAAELFSFPAYSTTTGGALIRAYLNGELGESAHIDSRLASLLFALDRFEMKDSLCAALEAGKLVLCDRYVASNLAHQAARAPRELRPALRAFIEQLEYRLYALPRPALVLYLDLPPEEARRRVALKGARAYTTKLLDAHEEDLGHLAAARQEYLLLASQDPSWATLSLFAETREGTRERSREELAGEIVTILEGRGLL